MELSKESNQELLELLKLKSENFGELFLAIQKFADENKINGEKLLEFLLPIFASKLFPAYSFISDPEFMKRFMVNQTLFFGTVLTESCMMNLRTDPEFKEILSKWVELSAILLNKYNGNEKQHQLED